MTQTTTPTRLEELHELRLAADNGDGPRMTYLDEWELGRLERAAAHLEELTAMGSTNLATGYPWGTFAELELAEELAQVTADAVTHRWSQHDIASRDACMDAANRTVAARVALIEAAGRETTRRRHLEAELAGLVGFPRRLVLNLRDAGGSDEHGGRGNR